MSFNNGASTSRSLNSTLDPSNEASNGTEATEITENSVKDKLYCFTGSAERVLAWNRVFKHNCYFEVIASVLSIQESSDDHKTILLKDKKGPILQILLYNYYILNETEFRVGQMLKCIGYMTAINTMTAVNIRTATPEEVASLKRCCYIGDFTISGLINAEENR